jgi:hypothetical protein
MKLSTWFQRKILKALLLETKIVADSR